MTATDFRCDPHDSDFDERLGEQITLLAGQINAAHHRLLTLIARFDECKAWSGGGTLRSCAHWLNWKCGIALGAAREKVRVAHSLRDLPLIDGAFARGEISYSKVRAMTRVATPENEDYLLMIAKHGTASHIEQLVGKYRRVQGGGEDDAERKLQLARRLVYYQDEDGMWVIHARLPPEAGSLVVKAIEAVTEPLREAQREAGMEKNTSEEEPFESRAQCRDVSAETFSEEVAATDPDRFRQLMEHSRADALLTITEHFLTTCDSTEAFRGLKGSERCQVLLHVDIHTLRRQESGKSTRRPSGPECCQLEEKQWLSPNTARRLSCDASLVTVLEDEAGQVFNIGRRARTVPPAIRRALTLRDRTCRVPGCCESRHVDAHHIEHWVNGGETSLDNLVLLCRRHHTQLHQGLFSIRVEKPEIGKEAPRLVFSSPAGREIERSFFPQFPDVSAETSNAALQKVAPGVDAYTIVPHWTGERCDYGMAVGGLQRRDVCAAVDDRNHEHIEGRRGWELQNLNLLLSGAL